jgi:ABC-type branched-subunit amino acid transport system ATPase component
MSDRLLEAEGVEAGYGAALVLHGVHVRAAPGEIVSIIGPNGAGKSTLLKALYGLVRVRAGRVSLRGTEVTHLRPDLRTRRGLNFVPQLANVFPSLTIAENLKVSVLALPRAERRAAIARTFELFPLLAERPRQHAGTLSGGQRKLLDLVRVLMLRPSLVLLDEPMAGVSPALRVELLEHILAVRRDRGITFLIVEHDLDFVMQAADRVVVMNEGRVLTVGSPDEVRADEQVVDAYLGRAH